MAHITIYRLRAGLAFAQLDMLKGVEGVIGNSTYFSLITVVVAMAVALVLSAQMVAVL